MNSVAVFPDGEKVVSGSYDKTAKLWDLEERRSALLQVYAKEEEACFSVTCVNMAGELLAEITEVTQQQPFSVLVALVRERIPPIPGARWQIVLPNAECAGHSQLDTPLGELFKL